MNILTKEIGEDLAEGRWCALSFLYTLLSPVHTIFLRAFKYLLHLNHAFRNTLILVSVSNFVYLTWHNLKSTLVCDLDLKKKKQHLLSGFSSLINVEKLCPHMLLKETARNIRNFPALCSVGK